MCVKNKEAKSCCLQSRLIVFSSTCLEVNHVDQSLKGFSKSSICHISACAMTTFDLWILPRPAPTATAGLKRMTVIQKKNKTLLDQFPRGRNKHIRSHSSSDRDGPRAQGAQQKRHETVQKGGNRWGQLEGVCGWRRELLKLSGLLLHNYSETSFQNKIIKIPFHQSKKLFNC